MVMLRVMKVSSMLRCSLHLLLVCCAVALPLHAQERVLTGVTNTPQTWQALIAATASAVARADAVTPMIDRAVACGRRGMVYSSAQAGDGCIYTGADMTLVNNMYTCGRQGKIYNGSGCVYAEGSAAAAAPVNCRLETKTVGSCHNSAGGCGTGWTILNIVTNGCGSQQDTPYQTMTCIRTVCG